MPTPHNAPNIDYSAAHGTVTIDGKTYTLTQEAYCDSHSDGTAYFALATDSTGALYEVRWDDLSDGHTCGEDGACVICGASCGYGNPDDCADWDHPSEVRAL